MREHARQVPYATALALSATVRDDLVPEARKLVGERIDRPSPFTQRAWRYAGARKRRLTAVIFAAPIQAGYLSWLEEGGVQLPRKRAHVIPVGQRRNQYGNMPRGRVQALLARADTFSGTVRGIGGIWQRRRNGTLKLLVRYADTTRYQPLLGFHERMMRAAPAAFERRFSQSLATAISTAR